MSPPQSWTLLGRFGRSCQGEEKMVERALCLPELKTFHARGDSRVRAGLVPARCGMIRLRAGTRPAPTDRFSALANDMFGRKRLPRMAGYS
jgi:hypothetical protein